MWFFVLISFLNVEFLRFRRMAAVQHDSAHCDGIHCMASKHSATICIARLFHAIILIAKIHCLRLYRVKYILLYDTHR